MFKESLFTFALGVLLRRLRMSYIHQYDRQLPEYIRHAQYHKAKNRASTWILCQLWHIRSHAYKMYIWSKSVADERFEGTRAAQFCQAPLWRIRESRLKNTSAGTGPIEAQGPQQPPLLPCPASTGGK